MLERPKIGVGVFIINKGKILLGKRKSERCYGYWSIPGGHLEFGESPQECARREVKEETGLDLGIIKKGPYTNDFFADTQKHYITIYCIAEYLCGTPEILEPDKCQEWKWFDWYNLPKPLFLPLRNLIEQAKDAPSEYALINQLYCVLEKSITMQ